MYVKKICVFSRLLQFFLIECMEHYIKVKTKMNLKIKISTHSTLASILSHFCGYYCEMLYFLISHDPLSHIPLTRLFLGKMEEPGDRNLK